MYVFLSSCIRREQFVWVIHICLKKEWSLPDCIQIFVRFFAKTRVNIEYYLLKSVYIEVYFLPIFLLIQERWDEVTSWSSKCQGVTNEWSTIASLKIATRRGGKTGQTLIEWRIRADKNLKKSLNWVSVSGLSDALSIHSVLSILTKGRLRQLKSQNSEQLFNIHCQCFLHPSPLLSVLNFGCISTLVYHTNSDDAHYDNPALCFIHLSPLFIAIKRVCKSSSS